MLRAEGFSRTVHVTSGGLRTCFPTGKHFGGVLAAAWAVAGHAGLGPIEPWQHRFKPPELIQQPTTPKTG